MASGDGDPISTYREMVQSNYAPNTHHRYSVRHPTFQKEVTNVMRNNRDIPHEAYQQVVDAFERELRSKTDVHTLIVAQATSMEEIHNIIDQAKSRYNSSGTCRKGILKCLNKFSSRIMCYSRVLDVLAQHHPEVAELIIIVH